MRRYIEIYSIMLRNSLIREMSFKANFLLWMIVEVLWFCGQIVFFSIIFGQVDRIGDWTKWGLVLLVVPHQWLGQFFRAFFLLTFRIFRGLFGPGNMVWFMLLPLSGIFLFSSTLFDF